LDILQQRRDEKACQRCGSKKYSHWYCPKSQPKAAVASAQPTQTIQPQKCKREDPNIKEESAPTEKKKKAAAIISIGGRIYELESKLMDMDD
jgi:hypothetical protein